MMTRLPLSAFLAMTALTAAACGETGQTAPDPESGADATGPAGDAQMAGEAMGEPASQASATLIDTDRNPVGTLTLTQGLQGVVLRIEADGLAQDQRGAWHGVHLHETGDCSAGDFTSAGSHINTLGNAHGLLNDEGPDNADLPNIWIHSDGTLRAEAYTTRVSIDGQTEAPALLGGDGSALIVHTNPDDQRSQPIGGAGARILCGVIEPAR